MKPAVLCASILLLMSLFGCASFKGAPDPVFKTKTELALLRSLYSDSKITTLYDTYYKSGQTEAERARIRNELVLARMYAIDLRYRDFEQALARESRQTGFYLKLISLGLTGTASLIRDSTAQAVLAGTDTAFKGASEAYSKDILIERTVQILTNQMRAERSRLRKEIIANLRMSTTDYPLMLALNQVEQLYAAGTLTGALASVNETIGLEGETQKKAEADQISLGIESLRQQTTPGSRSILSYIDAAQDENEKHRRRLRARECFAAADESDKPANFSLFITDAGNYKELEASIINCLNTKYGANISK